MTCLDDIIDEVGQDFFNLFVEKKNDLNKIMSRIFRKNEKLGMYNGKPQPCIGKSLTVICVVDDLVRENCQWEQDERCMRSIFNLVK